LLLCFVLAHTLALILFVVSTQSLNAQRSSTAVPGNKMSTSVPAVVRCSISLDSSAGEKVFGCPPNASS